MTGTLAAAPPEDGLEIRSLRAIGTTATVLVQRPGLADEAARMLAEELDAIDRACSRFRRDSELQKVHDLGGRAVRVSPLLFHALEVAVAVAERTHGAVDPTVGNAIASLGYDRDLSQLDDRGATPSKVLGPVVGFMHVQLNRPQQTVRIPRGVRLDLGSTAKALVADRAAARLADELGAGVLVSVGGDIAVAGPPPAGGWAVGIAVASATPAEAVDQVVAIRHGGLASSSASVRTWMAGSRQVHHIIDPRTGDCVSPHWTLVTATGTSCVEANALTTAALVWGSQALEHLSAFNQSVRLVRHDGRIFSLNGWPAERAA